MPTVIPLRSGPGPAILFLAAVALSACGGGGDGGGGGPGNLVTVSFIGFPTAPPPPGGPTPPLPTVFLDETLEFRFDAAIDDGSLGGFHAENGQVVEYLGVTASVGQGGVPYLAFEDQAGARASLEIRYNITDGPVVASYVVGRHRDRADTIIIDPVVPAANPFGLAPSTGLLPTTEFTYRIPAGNGLRFSTSPAVPAGSAPWQLPVIIPPWSPTPGLSRLFVTGTSVAGYPFPPVVTGIEAESGAAGTPAEPILQADPIRVTFSRPVDPVSVDSLQNIVVRNASLANQIVPGTLTILPPAPDVVVFTPIPGYGPGPFDIEVRVGTFGLPGISPILGLPQGLAATQLPLGNSLARTFRTAPCATCPGTTTVIESFDTTLNRDATFTPVFNPCGWNSSQFPGRLTGVPISGTPFASFGGGYLGTRVQRTLNTAFPGVIGGGGGGPAGLFSPFDDAGTNNFGANVNPAGGSHVMHLFEGADLGSPRDSLELVEWGPVNNFVAQTTYPNYYAWCGMTTMTGPFTCPVGVSGLSSVYSQNYSVVPPQPVDPLNPVSPPVTCPYPPAVPPGTAGGVRVSGGIPYNAGPGLTSYFPFPLFSPPFDYLGGGAGGANLLFEQNISPGIQVANFTRFRASAIAPVRRLAGAPKTLTTTCNAGAPNSAAAGCVTYDLRFTFVGIVASARSVFYDSGVPAPNYLSFALTPGPQSQPAGTSATWELEGASAISSPTTPSGSTSQFLTWWRGTPATGSFFPEVLSSTTPGGATLSGRRFFRFRVTLRNDPIANGRQTFNSAVMAATF